MFSDPVIVFRHIHLNFLSNYLTVFGVYDIIEHHSLLENNRYKTITLLLLQPKNEYLRRRLILFFRNRKIRIVFFNEFKTVTQNFGFENAFIGLGGPYYTILRTRNDISLAVSAPKYPDSHVRAGIAIRSTLKHFYVNNHQEVDPCTVLFITRTTKRRLLNKQAIADEILKVSGFKVLFRDYSSLTLPEQIKMTRKYEVLIAMHGAGMANFLFANQ
eukprot:Awhi_evm1s5977